MNKIYGKELIRITKTKENSVKKKGNNISMKAVLVKTTELNL